jgi:pimeloyl-ACP methyl ester carboxylesterase
MNEVISKDGTKIAYDREGSGPSLILVAGALCDRLSWSGPSLSGLLSPRFTVFNYDRRGRGDSGDTPPYAIEREIEDIEALIDEGGGEACLYGHSSGAALILEAAAQLGGRVKKLALYEAPYNDDPKAEAAWNEYVGELNKLLAQGRRGDAVALFMKYLGTPAENIEGMRHAPTWAGLEAVAPTLAYDHAAIMGRGAAVPAARAAAVGSPALVMHGSASYPFMEVTARALSGAMPKAQLRSVEGQGHDVSAEVLAPLLAEFFLPALD